MKKTWLIMPPQVDMNWRKEELYGRRKENEITKRGRQIDTEVFSLFHLAFLLFFFGITSVCF